jgi:iron(II)-dependent oxidoreductase
LSIAEVAQATGKERIAERLAATRERTLALIEPLSEGQLNTVYSELLSPLAWDLGHIANFEELWLVQTVGGLEPLDGALGRYYDAIENPRSVRNGLPLLRGEELRSYLRDVRERALGVLDRADLEQTENPLLEGGFAYEMLIAHERQHQETMLQLLQMVDGYECPGRDLAVAEVSVEPGPEMVEVPGGSYSIGAAGDGFAYDNERPRYTVEVETFRIDRAPVTNEAFARFIDETGAEPPLYWEPDGEGGWLHTAFGRRRPVDPRRPVVHVSCGQAADFARWSGRRLPTEFEWEAAASGADPAHANLDQLAYGCAPTGGYAEGASACGARQMLGDVWEWTASAFEAYPGFRAFPYSEYSEVFFGADYRVLRGGSWATCRDVVRTSFRNWDLPIRRQIFAGFRCAADSGAGS